MAVHDNGHEMLNPTQVSLNIGFFQGGREGDREGGRDEGTRERGKTVSAGSKICFLNRCWASLMS